MRGNFQKDVRKYISGEYYDDLDFVNCHPVILNQLLKKNNALLTSTDCVKSDGKSLLQPYIDDRKRYLEKHSYIKQDIIKMINNEVSSDSNFKPIHQQIYKELLPSLVKENKILMNRIKTDRKRKRKDYNHTGALLSHYLQNVENEMLMVLHKYLNDKGFTVGSLMYDGLMVEKTDDNVEEHLKIMALRIVQLIVALNLSRRYCLQISKLKMNSDASHILMKKLNYLSFSFKIRMSSMARKAG